MDVDGAARVVVKKKAIPIKKKVHLKGCFVT